MASARLARLLTGLILAAPALGIGGMPARADVEAGDFRLDADYWQGELDEWSVLITFFARNVSAMTVTPPGLDAIPFEADPSAPSPTGANFRLERDFESLEDLLVEFPEGTYVVEVVDTGATVELLLETTALDGILLITSPPDGAEGVSSTPIFQSDNRCASCESELLTLFGVDQHNFDILLQELREDVFPPFYTLADLDLTSTPPDELPDGRYQLVFETLIEEVGEPEFSNGDDFFLYARAAASDVSFFEVPEPSGKLAGLIALVCVAMIRRTRDRSTRSRATRLCPTASRC